MRMADQKIELEIALRDTVSQTLEAIASRLETMNKKMTRGGESISDSADTIKKLADNTKQTGLDAKDSTKSLLTMNDVLKQMSMLMVSGPVGAVVGIAVAAGMAAEGVTNFVKKRLELRNLATETGLSENQISVMQRAQDKMGIPLATATGNIKQIAGSLTELRIKKTGSELYQGLADIGQGKFADDLLKMVESGKIDEAARALIAKHAELRAIDIDTARKYATHAVKLPESMLIGYEEAARGLEPAYRVNLDHAVEWVKEMEIIHARARSVVDTAMHNAFGRMAWFVEHMDYSFLTGKPNPKYWGPSAPPAMPPLPSASGLGSATPKELDDLKYSKKESLKKQKDIGIILQDMWDKTKSTVGRQEGGPVTSGNMYRVGERGPEVFAAGGQYAMVGEGGPEVIRAPT